jgi:hypothetical protein
VPLCQQHTDRDHQVLGILAPQHLGCGWKATTTTPERDRLTVGVQALLRNPQGHPLSMVMVGALAGLSRDRVSSILAGRQDPPLSVAVRLAGVLGVSIGVLAVVLPELAALRTRLPGSTHRRGQAQAAVERGSPQWYARSMGRS